MAAEFSGAMPRLYGAPAYSRPPRTSAGSQRPFDPDDLPLEAHRSASDHELLADFPVAAQFSEEQDLEVRDAAALFRRSILPFGLGRRPGGR